MTIILKSADLGASHIQIKVSYDVVTCEKTLEKSYSNLRGNAEELQGRLEAGLCHC